MEGVANLPMGEFPAAFALQLPAMDMLVHSWDLARATGLDIEWDPDLVADNRAFSEATFSSPEFRGEGFGPPGKRLRRCRRDVEAGGLPGPHALIEHSLEVRIDRQVEDAAADGDPLAGGGPGAELIVRDGARRAGEAGNGQRS
jgi:hypothetical protein